ncbi:MAG: rod shape-determining protein MreC [Saprospiraceae bacterium]|nr:rod shape-determining protein MreC [Saprospiraceae bacterium]
MHSILQLFIRHGGLLTLVVVEVVCFFLITSNNNPQKEIYAASYLKYSGTVLNWKREFLDYWYLRDENIRLRVENARLNTQLSNSRIIEVPSIDTVRRVVLADTLAQADKLVRPEYTMISARVIQNSISSRNNWMVINRGRLDGVQPNSGVVTPSGVAGVVREVSDHFAAVMSVLHRQTKISAALKGHDYFGSLVWEGGDPDYMDLTDIPYHIPVKPGDTVQVSNYTLLFPEGHLAGLVDTAYRIQGSNFLKIRVKLSQSPADIQHVYVVTNRYAGELEQLQQAVKDEQ